MNDTGESIERPALAHEPQGFLRYAPVPAWAACEPAPAMPDQALEDFTDQGLLRILHETQLSLMEPGFAVYMRVLQRVLTRTGAERAANVALEFDPAHEQLEVHSISVWRDGLATEYARPGAMQLLRRESQLERLTLNGRLTASFVVPDLRAGDQLEVRFTQFSGHPVLSGRYGGWLAFNAYGPWVETRVRLIRPLSRAITLKPFNSPPAAEARSEGGCEELRCSLVGQKRLALEDLMPAWTVKAPCYQVSEFSSWGEVAHLFAPHYQDSVLPEGVGAACAEIAVTRSDPATLAVEWLRFVQRTLRYFALALGDGGLLPRDLETIWQRRFADCKDAVRFYVAGARRLGLDACAALVSTTHGLSLDTFLPSAQLFNHVIVCLRIGENTYWLDPTLPPQAGSLQQLVAPHAGWALPLTRETQALEALPDAVPVEHVHCEDLVTLGPKPESPARLERRFDLRFWAADNMRHRIANDGSAKLAAQLLRELLGTWPRAVETQPPSFEENPHSNTLTMRCGYEIPDPWIPGKDGRRWALPLLDTVTNKELARLQVTRRNSPILLGRPRRVSWRTTVKMPRRWWGKGWQQVLEEPGLRFTGNLKIAGKEVMVDRELTVAAWSVPAAQADGYVRMVTKLNQNVTQLFAHKQLGRVVSPVRFWRRLLANRWHRVALISIIFILYLIVSTH
jgi:Domain of Unknown Function with PDB structure (DUF3857)